MTMHTKGIRPDTTVDLSFIFTHLKEVLTVAGQKNHIKNHQNVNKLCTCFVCGKTRVSRVIHGHTGKTKCAKYPQWI